MMRAFKDQHDGYYQHDGDDVPAWAVNLVPCDLVTPPAPTPEEIKKQKKAEIVSIEKDTLMNRAVREFMLLSAEAQAAAQGITPEQLYTLNPAYKSVKDVDNQISALRAKLK